MRPIHRWSLVALVGSLLALAPLSVRALPTHDVSMTASQLLARIQAGRDTAYSGMVESSGRVGLPVTDHFTDIADLLGGDTRMRVWWRSDTDWRVDKLLTTGEIDLIHYQQATVEWNYERAEAQTSIDPSIRLPRAADLLPPALARRVLADVDPAELTRLPAQRIAGVEALGLRLAPSDPRTSIDHADLWADPRTGLVLRVSAYGVASQPALSTTFTSLSIATPAPVATAFRAATGVRQSFDDVLDIADAANQFAPVVPPGSIAGLPKSDSSLGAVGIYGHGLAQVMALPLQQRDAAYLADQLTKSGALVVDNQPLLRVGPLGVYLATSHQPFEFSWLITGTVTDETLRQAATDLEAGAEFR